MYIKKMVTWGIFFFNLNTIKVCGLISFVNHSSQEGLFQIIFQLGHMHMEELSGLFNVLVLFGNIFLQNGNANN